MLFGEEKVKLDGEGDHFVVVVIADYGIAYATKTRFWEFLWFRCL